MNTILLGQSYFLRFDPKLWRQMQPYPPLGTLVAASCLRRHGYDVALFDAMLAESEDEWAQRLDQERPAFAILYEDEFNYLSKMCLLRMRQAAFAMIDMARRRGCTVIVCGADATDHAVQYLARQADFVLLGEGEETLVELMDILTGKSSARLESVLGLAYSAGGVAHCNPRRLAMRDLDALPWPAWDLVDVARYRRVWQERHGYHSMNMVTSRGCPFHCNWCAKPMWGQSYAVRSPDNVADELSWLKRTYQPGHIWFADDIFGLNPGWVAQFGERVRSLDAAIPFKCLSRPDVLSRPGEVDTLERAGATLVWMGAESGSQRILDAMDKGVRVEQIRDVARLLQAAHIQVGLFLQFGYPGETRADIEKTLQLVRDCRPDDIGISVSYPMPGTPFYAAVREQLGGQQNWRDSDDLAMLFRGPFSTAFYRKLHSAVHKEFRARKAWHALKHGFSLRQLAHLVYGLATLPATRWQLDRLAAQSPGAGAPLPHLPHELAVQPTAQDER